MVKSTVTNIIILDDVSIISVNILNYNENTIKHIFDSIFENNINVDMITLSPYINEKSNLCFTVCGDDVGTVINSLGCANDDKLLYSINGGNSKITVLGCALSEDSSISPKILEVLTKLNICAKIFCSSVNEISFVIDEIYVDDVLKELRGMIL